MIPKFRGKRKDGVWVEGFYCQWQNRHYIAPSPHESGFNSGEIISYEIAGWFEVDPATVGQFTGLCDKNGKEIYEGDRIVNYWQNGLKSEGIIDFKDGSFRVIGDDESYEWLPELFRKCNEYKPEVIGTVHDQKSQTAGWCDVIRNIKEKP